MATGVGLHSGGLSTREGHAAGAERIIDFLGWCADLGIPQVTLYMLSTENLKRPADELTGLMPLSTNSAAAAYRAAGTRARGW